MNDRLVLFYCLRNHDMICNQFWIQIVEGQALRGQGGVFMKIFSKSTFQLFLIEGSDI